MFDPVSMSLHLKLPIRASLALPYMGIGWHENHWTPRQSRPCRIQSTQSLSLHKLEPSRLSDSKSCRQSRIARQAHKVLTRRPESERKLRQQWFHVIFSNYLQDI